MYAEGAKCWSVEFRDQVFVSVLGVHGAAFWCLVKSCVLCLFVRVEHAACVVDDVDETINVLRHGHEVTRHSDWA